MPWSRFEVEATVASYFDMLELGLQGQPFNKTAFRRELLPMLDGRTAGAVERKHQNISAILIEERVPYISGYKPLGNYQGLLRHVVLEQLAARRHTRALIEREVTRVPEPPSIDDILAALTAPPRPRPGVGSSKRRKPYARPPVDYLAREAATAALGKAGEEFVLNFERARLEAAGKGALAGRVEHVSVARGDGLGYDILSFDADSRERLIEVKTTKYGEYTPFYVTRNEVSTSTENAPLYHLYRLYAFGQAPRLFTRSGALDQSFDLEPSAFVARV